MVLLLSGMVAVVVWVLVWALLLSGFDGFLFAIVIMLIGATIQLILPYLPGRRDPGEEHPDPAPYL
jgi:hypothetical protein